MIDKMSYRVIMSYLSEATAAAVGQEDGSSKEDKAKQTQAVEKLLREVITKKLPQYRDAVFAVGGFVRDKQLGRDPKDIDIVVDDPKQKMKAAEVFAKDLTEALGITSANNPHPLKEKYGIWGVVLSNPKSEGGKRKPFVYEGVDLSGYVIQATPPREEGPYSFEKREPSYVKYTSRKGDAQRRDLTINALYENIATGEIEDHVGGMEDLRKKNLRPPEHPEGIESIYEEDPLRVLRLIRFKGELPGFETSDATKKAIKSFLESPEGRKAMEQKLSKERIQEEFIKILTNPDSAAVVEGMELLRDLDLLRYISPELEKMLDVYHDSVFHGGESVWQHTMNVLKKTPPTLRARLAALFHDIGKVETRTEKVDPEGRDRVHFIGHEDVSKKKVNDILRDLKIPNDIIRSVQDIVQAHMEFKSFEGHKAKTQMRKIRGFIEDLYGDLEDAISLLKADALDDPQEQRSIEAIARRIKDQKDEDIRKGLLREKGKGAEYIDPLSGSEIKQEYGELTGQAIDAVKAKLKKFLMEGKFDDLEEKRRAEEARELLKGLVRNQQQLDGMVRNYLKKKSS